MPIFQYDATVKPIFILTQRSIDLFVLDLASSISWVHNTPSLRLELDVESSFLIHTYRQTSFKEQSQTTMLFHLLKFVVPRYTAESWAVDLEKPSNGTGGQIDILIASCLRHW